MSNPATETHGNFGRKMDSFGPADVHGEMNPSGDPATTFEERLALLGPVAIGEFRAAVKRNRAYRVATDAHLAEREEYRADMQKAGLHWNAAQSDPSAKPRDVKRFEAAYLAAKLQFDNCTMDAKPSRLQTYNEFAREFIQRKYEAVGTTDSWPADVASDEDALDYRVTELRKNQARILNLEAESCSRDEMELNIEAAVDGLRTGAPVIISEKDGRVVWPIRMMAVGNVSKDVVDVAAILSDLLGPELKAALKARIKTPVGGGMQKSQRAAKMAELTAEREAFQYKIAFWVRRIESKGGTVDVRWPMKPEHFLDIRRVR